MAEWRLLRGWSRAELESRMDGLQRAGPNFAAVEEEMTGNRGWDHYFSVAVIAPAGSDRACFERARVALASYQFSNPDIVTAHFHPDTPLLERRFLLEIKVLGLRYLCPAGVSRVRDDPSVYGFRYDTLDGHIERGVEWFLLTRSEDGEIRFRIEARWQLGQLPNWWSRVGFLLLARRYQERWHRQAHQRMSMLARYGSLAIIPPNPSGLVSRGVDVTFTYNTRRKALLRSRP